MGTPERFLTRRHDHPVPEPLWVDREGTRVLSPIRAQAFLGLVRAAQAVDDDLDAGLRATHGLSLRGFEVLLHLAAFTRDGSARVTQLVEQLPLSQSRTSRLLVELEQDGLVTRTTDDTDRRGVRVAITSSGRRRFRVAQETHLADLERRLFSRLSWDEVVALANIAASLLTDEPGAGTDLA